MKRTFTFLLAVILTFSLVVPAIAVDKEAASLTFSLDVNGENNYTAKQNEIITVSYYITANEETVDTASTQDEIVYDHNFFQLVDDSIEFEYHPYFTDLDFATVFTGVLNVDTDAAKTHIVKVSSTQNHTFYEELGKVKICTFKLKVLPSSGVSTVVSSVKTRSDGEVEKKYFATGESSSYINCNKSDLTVTVGAGDTVKVSGISLNKTSTTLDIGADDTLIATVVPTNATNKDVVWTSSKETVARVDANGKVTGIAAGDAVIAATTIDGGKTATCTVTVTKGDVFTVNASCGAGGTITPAGEQIVKKGEDLTFTFKANENYAIKDVKIDGVSNAAAIESGSYAFNKVEKDHTIYVAFEKTGDAPVTNPFSDVKEGEYYYDAVLWAVENGVTQGTSTTTFSPTSLVTRAQMVTFLWRAAGCPEPTGSAGTFTDVQRGNYYEKAVAWAIERGITKGTSATTFSPDTVCTRGQVVTLLARFAGVQDAVTQSVFSDVKSTDYFAAAVNWAKDNGVTSGTSATTFSPNADCSRGQIVTFLYRWMVR